MKSLLQRVPVQAAWLGMIVLAGSSTAAQTLTTSPSPVPSALYAQAPVVLDGQTLFTVAVASNATGQLPVAVRANDIHAVLAQIVGDSNNDGRPEYDPRTLRVAVHREGTADVIRVTDAKHKNPLNIVTVTTADAAAQNETTDALAAEWQETLQGALVHAAVIREPRVQKRHLIQAAIALAVLLLVSLGIGFALRRLSQRITDQTAEVEKHRANLASAQTAEAAGAETSTQGARRKHSLIVRALKPAQTLTVLRAIRDLLVWVLLLLWCAGAAWTALLFPQTTPFGHTLIKNALVIVSIFVITGVIDRALTVVIGRLPLVWEMRHFSSSEQRERQTLRMPTIVRAVNGFKTFVLFFIAALSALTQIGIPVGSVVTIGGVAAIAVSLAAQNLIRDVVSGFLVLSEDQFVLGDFVTINGASGVVERLTLRMVQLRDGSGGVVTISHSAATSVVNHSRSWSRVDYAVAIDAAADAQAAIDILRTTIQGAIGDQTQHPSLRESIEWIGVEGLSRDGIVIRARVRTGAVEQFALRRELNLRVSRAFRDAKIALGAPVASIAPSS